MIYLQQLSFNPNLISVKRLISPFLIFLGTTKQQFLLISTSSIYQFSFVMSCLFKFFECYLFKMSLSLIPKQPRIVHSATFYTKHLLIDKSQKICQTVPTQQLTHTMEKTENTVLWHQLQKGEKKYSLFLTDKINIWLKLFISVTKFSNQSCSRSTSGIG